MSGTSGRWKDAKRAWNRLAAWEHAEPSGDDDGVLALDALDDICRLRHLLDQSELVAVRAARRHGRSWAEVATRLGMTRQSAWERWKDLDDEQATHGAVARAAEALAAEALPADTLPAEIGSRRRRGTVRVPNVVGLSWSDARAVLSEVGLLALAADPDAPPVLPGEPGGVVVDQTPESGARIAPGSAVRLWLDRGSGGVREPRRPKPAPRTGRAARPEPTEEAVS